MTKIITISGKARNGKDQLATYIQEEIEKQNKTCKIFHYADVLKFICKQYYDWDGEKDEKGRNLLQYIGTDLGRTQDENVWVKFSFLIIQYFLADFDYIIIPDCRFPNEIESWKDAVVASIRVERPNFNNGLTIEQQNHSSETALDLFDFEYYIEAETLDELKEAAQWVFNEITKFEEN